MYKNNIIHFNHMNPTVGQKRETQRYRLACIYTTVITTVEALVTLAIGAFSLAGIAMAMSLFIL